MLQKEILKYKRGKGIKQELTLWTKKEQEKSINKEEEVNHRKVAVEMSKQSLLDKRQEIISHFTENSISREASAETRLQGVKEWTGGENWK